MRESVPVSLGPVQETLLIPLLGRARETTKTNGLLGDPKAVEIVNTLDYDFSKWEGGRSLVGACLRTRMFDRYVEDFLSQNPGGTVIELGCGLNTRFERVDNGIAQWFDVDLPDVIALRRLFFRDTPRRNMVEASALDEQWIAAVSATGGPWIVVAEAVLIYLDSQDARRVIELIAGGLAGVRIAFDTTSQSMVEKQSKHDAMRHLPPESWFRWGCDDPRVVESWNSGLRLASSKTFLDADEDLVARFPTPLRWIVRYLPWVLRSAVEGYRLNLVVADGEPSTPRPRAS